MKNENGIEKSAILKGKTLVNMLQFKGTYTALFNIGSYLYSDNKITIVGNGVGEGFAKSDITVNLESNKTYTFKGNCDKGFNDDNGFVYLLLNNSSSNATRINTGNTTFQVRESGVYYVRLDIKDSSQSYVFSDLMILEGDYTNQVIPYFEGMQSVKMPALMTTGKNLWNTSILNSIPINNYYISTDLTLKELCPDLVVGETYIASMRYDYTGQITGTVGVILIPFLDITNHPFTYTDDLKDSRVYVYGGNATGTAYDFQIEKGTVATTYEPYKSNILSTSEEVELRGIGDVQDTLDLMTGEYTKAIY